MVRRVMVILLAGGCLLAACGREPGPSQAAPTTATAPAASGPSATEAASAPVLRETVGVPAEGVRVVAPADAPKTHLAPQVDGGHPGQLGPRPELNWDFRDERTTGRVKWPENSEADYWTIEGNFQLSLALHDGTLISEQAQVLAVRRRDDLVDGLALTSNPLSAEEAFGRVKTLLAQLHFDEAAQAKLETWRSDIKAGRYSPFKVRVRNEDSRLFTVRLINEGAGEKPWSIGLDMDWSHSCGCTS